MTFVVFLIITFIAVFVLAYRAKKNENVYKFISDQIGTVYEKVAPYSYKEIKEKVKDLKAEYTLKQYITQAILFAGVAGVISYLYFYSIIWSIVYAVIAVSIIPYITYLRYKKVYSEFIFEQIQVYATNVIMEYQTTKSFVKSLEGVYNSGVLEDPVLTDVKIMLDII